MSQDEYTPLGETPIRLPTDRPAAEELPLPPVVVPPDLGSMEPISQPYAASAPPVREDLRVSWGWRDVLLFLVCALFATELVTWGMVYVSVKVFGGSTSDFVSSSMTTSKSILLLASQTVLDGGAILFLYLMVRSRTAAPFWPEIGWRKLQIGMHNFSASVTRCLAGGAMLAVAVTFLSSFMNSKNSLPIEQILQARVSIVLFAILGVLVAPLVEETIFRGFLYPVIARRMGIAAGVIITGILFGLMHAAQLWGGWGQIALLIIVGVLLTWVRARTGTVTASFFVHLGYNGLQLLGYLAYLISGIHR